MDDDQFSGPETPQSELREQLVKVALFDVKSYDRSSFVEALEKCRPLFQDNCAGPLRVEFVFIEPRLSEETAVYAQGCRCVCCFVNDKLNARVVAALADLDIELILLRCAGFDQVDLSTCRELGIAVCRVPAYSPHAVAEFAVALLMAVNRKTHAAYNRVRNGNFTLQGLVGLDLHGKTVGVVGTGKIGFCFAKIMLGFGCTVLAYDVMVNKELEALDGVTYSTLPDLLSQSDIVSLHAPLLPSTHHMINRHSINIMKPGVLLVNTSRGGLIDTKALVEGLISGRIGAAGLDVYENEGEYFFRDCSDQEIEDEVLARLQNMRNVLLTSHQAFLTREALNSIAMTTIRSLAEFFVQHKRGRELTNTVLPPQEDPAVQRALSRRLSKLSRSSDSSGAAVGD